MTALTQIVADPSLRCGPATISPLGELRVENPASNLFLDTFDNATALDTINRWSSSSGGTGASVVVSAGQVVLNGGTGASSFARVVTQPAARYLNGPIGIWRPSDPGYILDRLNLNVPFPVTLNNLVQWGNGNAPATPTIASSMTDFYGYEITIAGKLQAVTYASGVRLLIQDLSAAPVAQPADANAHKYFVYFRGDICYWCIDDKDNIVAQFQTGASGPNVNALPVIAQVISNSGANFPLQLNAVSVGDTSHLGGSQLLSNGVTYEPQCSNQDANSTVVTLAAQGAGTINSPDFVNVNGKGVVIGINTTVDAAGAYTVAIQGKDIVSGQYYTITAPGSTPVAAISGTIAATGFQQITVYPGITSFAGTPTLGGAVNMPLPRTWRIQVVVTTGPITATIGASVIN